MCPTRLEGAPTQTAERLYLDLLYCRADAQLCDFAHVAHLLNLACEEMQTLVDAERREIPVPSESSALYVFPEMK